MFFSYVFEVGVNKLPISIYYTGYLAFGRFENASWSGLTAPAVSSGQPTLEETRRKKRELREAEANMEEQGPP